MAANHCKVHITYPSDLGKDLQDEAWLYDVSERHNGRLDGSVMESFPQQRYATFSSVDDARAFVDELSRAGRWRAATSS